MIKLIPYVEVNGMRSLTDEALRDFWLIMQGNGLDKIVFSRGEVKSESEFIKYAKIPTNVVHFGFVDDRIAGVYWLNNFKENSAMAHFCILPTVWGKNTSLDMSRKSLEYWFGDAFVKPDGNPLLDVIIGEIPTVNKHAINHVRRVGLARLGNIPDMAYGGEKIGSTILYVTRRYFKNE